MFCACRFNLLEERSTYLGGGPATCEDRNELSLDCGRAPVDVAGGRGRGGGVPAPPHFTLTHYRTAHLRATELHREEKMGSGGCGSRRVSTMEEGGWGGTAVPPTRMTLRRGRSWGRGRGGVRQGSGAELGPRLGRRKAAAVEDDRRVVELWPRPGRRGLGVVTMRCISRGRGGAAWQDEAGRARSDGGSNES